MVAAGGRAAADAAVAAGGIEAVAAVLRSSSTSLAAKESATWLICVLADGDAERQAAFTGAGAVPPLVRLLGGALAPASRGSATLAPLAAAALKLLASACDVARRQIAAEGGVPLLVRCLSPAGSDVCSLGLRCAAAQALGGVAAADPALAHAVAAAGAVQPLVRSLRSAKPEVASTAAEALWKLALAGPALRHAIMAAGAPVQLVRCLRSADADVLENAAAALANVADGYPAAAEATAAAGGVPLLLPLLCHASAAVQLAAVEALCNTCRYSTAMEPAVQAEVLPALVAFCGSRCPSERALKFAAQTLAHVASCSSDAAVEVGVAAGGGAQGLVQLLCSSCDSGSCCGLSAAAGALANMAASSKQPRLAVVGSRAIPLLLLQLREAAGLGAATCAAGGAGALLCNLTASDPAACAAVVAADGVATLLGVLRVAQAQDAMAALHYAAAGTLAHLATGGSPAASTVRQAVEAGGGAAILERLLRSGDERLQEQAALGAPMPPQLSLSSLGRYPRSRQLRQSRPRLCPLPRRPSAQRRSLHRPTCAPPPAAAPPLACCAAAAVKPCATAARPAATRTGGRTRPSAAACRPRRQRPVSSSSSSSRSSSSAQPPSRRLREPAYSASDERSSLPPVLACVLPP